VALNVERVCAPDAGLQCQRTRITSTFLVITVWFVYLLRSSPSHSGPALAQQSAGAFVARKKGYARRRLYFGGESPLGRSSRARRTDTRSKSSPSCRMRYVPLTVRLASALREHRHLRGGRVLCTEYGEPITQRVVQGFVLRAARSIGIQNAGVHVLRHTFCSHLAMRGGAARAIQELAGHRDLVTTQRYMHLSPAAVEGAIRLLDQHPAPPPDGDIVETGTGAVEKGA
jgi:hypothetical protein